MKRALILQLAVAAALAAHASERHQLLIASTPCLYEYRSWFFTFRRPAEFPRPAQFTAEQCALAAQLHTQIQAELEEEDSPAGQARLAAEEAAAKASSQAAYAASPAGRAAAALELRQQAESRRLAQEARARSLREKRAQEAQAAKPDVQLGMTAQQVIHGTRWGAPMDRVRRTDATGTYELWSYYGRRSLVLHNGKVTVINE